VRIVLPYVLFSLCYILGGDYLVALIAPTPDIITTYQSVKGMGFLLLSTLLLIALLKREEKQRQTEQATQQRLNTILEATTDFVATADARHKLLFMNGALQQLSGLSGDKAGKFSLEQGYPEWARRIVVEEAIPAAMRDGIWRGETALLDASGAEVPVSQVIMAHYDAEGKVEYFSTIARDVSERRRVEEQLRKREWQLAQAQRLARLGNWEWNVLTDELEWSDEMYQLFGRSPGTLLHYQEVIGQLHPDDAHLLDLELVASANPYYVTHRLIRPDGELRWVHFTARTEKDENGQIIRLSGVCQDITEQQQAQEALRLSEERFRSLVQAASQIVWRADADGIPTDASDTSSPNLIRSSYGARWLDYVHPADRDRVGQIWQHSVERKVPYHTELRLLCPDGSYAYFEARAVPIFDARGAVREWIGMSININERKQTEEQLQRFAEKLEQRNRELQDFAYIASHDLQEPLRKIKTFSELLQQDYATVLDASGQDYLQRMRASATRMQTLITDLLNLSRVATRGQAFRTVELSQVLQEVLSDLEVASQQEDARIIVHELPAIQADATQMRQLFQNLLVNALKFRRADVPPQIDIFVEPFDEACCRIIVRDNGIGFDEQFAEKVFQPFQRLHGHSAYSGSGMGLAICRKIVERHQGEIFARSTPGAGSEFVVTLPLQHDESDQ
jgi:PAS domain S-box-containing protein